MPRFRRSMALRPINRIKHVVDNALTVVAGSPIAFGIALATDTPTLGVASSVETGSKINGFYIRLEVASNEAQDIGAVPNAYFYLWKNPGSNLTRPSANAVGTNDNKRFVIHQEMTMIENTGFGGNGRTLFNGVIVVPKGMRRMGPTDLWEAVVLAPALNTAICIQVHYKEFR